MPDYKTLGLPIFNASHARNLAETKWGRSHLGHSTTRIPTNRKGAYWFNCANGAGFIIDARCLTDQEKADLDAYHQPHMSTECYDENYRVQFRTNPYVAQMDQIKSDRKVQQFWGTVKVPVYAFRGYQKFSEREWCLPVLLAGIKTETQDIETALQDFQIAYNPSAHEIIELHARLLSREPCGA
jgi:hypothetical protein